MSTMERIVVGGDHTPSATAALRWAVGEAARTGACIAVVHAFDLAGRADLAREPGLARARGEARYCIQSWVVEVIGDLNTSVPVIVSTTDASVARALVTASRGAVLVAIGRPHNGRNRDLAAILERACECPVVTVTSDDLVAAP